MVSWSHDHNNKYNILNILSVEDPMMVYDPLWENRAIE